ncbi:hypothetical protein N9N67_00030 [Bacteriovoracaceae bacterium]|nr:hypothetical protein [Bacteriovoracaceae bacterium]
MINRYLSTTVFRKSSTVYKLILVSLFMPLYFHILLSLFFEHSALSEQLFIETFENHKTYLALSLVSLFTIYRYSKYSRLFYMIYLIYPFAILSFLLFTRFDNIILIGLFFYLVTAYQFYYTLVEELNRSFANSFREKIPYLNGQIKRFNINLNSAQFEVKGSLTNWSSDSIFVELDSQVPLRKLKKNKNLQIEIDYQGQKFNAFAKLVSYNKDGKGAGFVITNEPTLFSYSDLITILNNHKIVPRGLV